MTKESATPFKLNVKEPYIFSLILLSAFASMGAALITPALPAIAQYFNIPAAHAQLTVTSFLLGYAVGQLIYGPLANRFGRKPAFYMGICVATLGSIFSIISSPLDSFTLMIMGRLLEALGSSVGLVISFTIINDFYFPDQARKMIGFLVLAFAVIPGIAITIGGFITEYRGWQTCFYFLLVYGLLLFIPALKLPETITIYDKNALQGRYLLSVYLSMFKKRKLLIYSLICGLSSACIYIFSAEGPLIGIHILGFPPATYGILGLIPYLGAVGGSLITINYAQRVSGLAMIKLGIFIEITAAFIMFLSFAFHMVTIFTLISPMLLFLVGHALLAGNASALAINQSEDKANASAVVNFTIIATAVIGTFILTRFHAQNVIVLPSLFILSVALMICLFFLGSKAK